MVYDLQLKLNGELPVTRSDLFELVDSWGRFGNRSSREDSIKVYASEPKECYNLSKLDVSNVKDMCYLFYYSNFNGDINEWNISAVSNMNYMFGCSKFDGDISSWQFNKNISCDCLFYANEKFENKYNNGNNNISSYSHEFIKWLEDNREKIKDINISKKEVLDFFSFDIDNLNKDIN